MKDKARRPWLSVIIGDESLVSHAGGTLLVETARRSGLATELVGRLGPWRLPLAVHAPGKVVLDLAVAVALGGDAACDIALLRAQPGLFGLVASDPTVSRRSCGWPRMLMRRWGRSVVLGPRLGSGCGVGLERRFRMVGW